MQQIGVVDEQDEAHALPAMLVNMARFAFKRVPHLKARIAKALGAGANVHKIKYMKLRYSKLKAALLANDFMM